GRWFIGGTPTSTPPRLPIAHGGGDAFSAVLGAALRRSRPESVKLIVGRPDDDPYATLRFGSVVKSTGR
ncbi:MAG: hypothetical protein WCF33_15070, partial [Pseudonocardiaceae bacterium]